MGGDAPRGGTDGYMVGDTLTIASDSTTVTLSFLKASTAPPRSATAAVRTVVV